MAIKNKLTDWSVNGEQAFGIYRGVVEDRFDPEKLGRCRVRVLGIHDETKVKDDYIGIPTDELPWAEPCQSLYQGSVSGNGEWYVPLQGTWLWVFFENGNVLRPKYFATCAGLPIEPPNPEIGFNDPDAEWPDAGWLEEPDWHRYAKKDKLGDTSLLLVKKPKQDKGVAIAFGGTWDEYPPMYQAEYPFNDVKCSHTGIYSEIDNTEGNRRLHFYHPSNSYLEIGEEGNMTFRNNKQRWDIVIEQMYEHIFMDYHRKCDMNRTTLVDMTMWEEIKLDRYTKIHLTDRKDVLLDQLYHIFNDNVHYVDGNRDKYVGLNELNYVEDNLTRYVGISELVYIGEDFERYVGVDVITKVDGERHSYVAVKDRMECDGPIIIRSSDRIVLEAPDIIFRGGNFWDHMETTEIAGDFEWNGVADGAAAWSKFAEEIRPMEENVVEAEAAEAPTVPSIMEPAPPTEPPEIPVPPPPPVPPELDYVDVPPDPPFCPFPG